jgi:hypothetical protein
MRPATYAGEVPTKNVASVGRRFASCTLSLVISAVQRYVQRVSFLTCANLTPSLQFPPQRLTRKKAFRRKKIGEPLPPRPRLLVHCLPASHATPVFREEAIRSLVHEGPSETSVVLCRDAKNLK